MRELTLMKLVLESDLIVQYVQLIIDDDGGVHSKQIKLKNGFMCFNVSSCFLLISPNV